MPRNETNVICRNIGEIIELTGSGLSTIGFVVILATALMFRPWWKNPVNKVWLFMCATKIAFVLLMSFYTLYRCERIPAPGMETVVGSSFFWAISDYFMLSTSTWLAAGAWIAHKQLVVVMPDESNSRIMLKTSLCAWLTPIPFCITRVVLWRPVPPIYFSHMLPTIYKVFISVSTVLSLSMYIYVLVSICSARRPGTGHRELTRSILLGIMFILLSGFQFIIVIIVNAFYEDRPAIKLYMFSCVVLLIYYSVFVYAILFTVGVRKTREMWSEYLGKKIQSIKSGFTM